MADEKTLGTYEMLWDCQFCDTKKLLGITHRHCPNCGAEQDQTKRYFPSDADKVAVKDDVYAGTDKACGSCGAPNGAKATFCMKCGAPLGEAGAVKTRSERVVPAGAGFAADDVKKAQAELAANAKPQQAAPKKKSWLWLYIVLAIAGLIFLIWFMCIRKKTADFVVEAQRWKRTIAIEEYKLVGHEQWQDQLPNGAQNLDCHDKQYTTKKVPGAPDCQDKQVDNGNGTFSEKRVCTPTTVDEAVNKSWCKYQVYEWTKTNEMSESAEDGKEPAWPTTGVPAQPLQVPGAKREGARTDVYEVDVFDQKNNQRATCAIDKNTWDKLTRGTSAKGEERARSGEIVCDSIHTK